MENSIRPAGNIITFYSFKGGVGRSMALANIARCAATASRGERILAIDWDLDAPGLHRFFPGIAGRRKVSERGLIDYFITVRDKYQKDPRFASAMDIEHSLDALEEAAPLDDYLVRDAAPGVDVMLAGNLNDLYPGRVSSFGWAEFYENHYQAINLFRQIIKRKYRYCFVDSRTGYTDTSGICTAIMPEKLVVLFIPNEQNLEGVLKMVELAVEYRRCSEDSRPLAVFPVASRIDHAQQVERLSWLTRFQYSFETLFTRLYGCPCDLTAHFDAVQLPNVSYYSYGERVAMLDEERSRAGSLRQAYEVFASSLFEKPYPWA